MILIVLVSLLGLIAFVGVIACFVSKKEDGIGPGLALIFFVCLPIILTSILIPIGRAVHLQDMTAFYEANVRNYGISVDRSEAILSENKIIENALIPVDGSVEKLRLADSVVELLKEYRDEAVTYNRDLKRFQYLDKHVWVGYYYPTPPDELKLLVIK